MMKWLFVLLFTMSSVAGAQKKVQGKKHVVKRNVITLSSWSVGGRLWQERTYLLDASGRSYALTGDFYGGTLGYQRTSYRSAKMSFRHEVYGFFGAVNVSSADSAISYFEKGLTVVGGGISETVLWTAAKHTLEYGLNLDVFYRRAIFPEPTTQTTLDNVDRVHFILGPQVRWNISGRTFLEQRLGYSPDARDVVWNFGLAYRGSLW